MGTQNQAEGFKVLGINHIGLAPKDAGKAKFFFETLLSLRNIGEELVKEQKTLTTMFASKGVSTASSSKNTNNEAPNAVEPRLEILEPAAATTDGPISKFLEKKGSGIHHLALSVDNVERAIKLLLSKGIRMIDEVPRGGAHNTKIAFVHPESTGGLLVELVEEATH